VSGARPAFEGRTIAVSLDRIVPTRPLGSHVRRSPKFRTILASVREVGIVEPLAVYPEAPNTKANGGESPRYLLLDGHLRFEALKVLGAAEALCLVAADDEGFTYNRRINRVSAVQEHRMILKAISKQVPPERIARSLGIDVERIHARQCLLDGIASEAVELLKDRMVSQGAFAVLRKMRPLRQIEAAEMMNSANRFTTGYAKMVLAATRPELLATPKKARPAEASPEDIARMEREMEKLQHDHSLAEDTLGETILVLVVARGYLARLLRNAAVGDYLTRHHADLAVELSAVVEAIGTDVRGTERE